jgi:hypothetical protein
VVADELLRVCRPGGHEGGEDGCGELREGLLAPPACLDRQCHEGKVGSDGREGAEQPTEAPARLSTSARDEPPSPAGPNGPFARSKSWQTVGSTMGVVAAFALAAGTATAIAAVTAVAAIRDSLRANMSVLTPRR